MKKLITLLSVVCLLFVGTANSHGSILVNAVESNGDVVFSGGGTVDTSGLSYFGTYQVAAALLANSADISLVAGTGDRYAGISGPSSIGPGGIFFPTSFVGDVLYLAAPDAFIYLPENYVSGSAISASMTFAGQTFASLGLTPGTYTWTWGDDPAVAGFTPDNSDSFTLQIGPIPEPTTAIVWTTLAGVGLFVWRFRRRFY